MPRYTYIRPPQSPNPKKASNIFKKEEAGRGGVVSSVAFLMCSEAKCPKTPGQRRGYWQKGQEKEAETGWGDKKKGPKKYPGRANPHGAAVVNARARLISCHMLNA